jgi:hypothetical protein
MATALYNWIGTAAANVGSTITYIIKGSPAPVSITPIEQEEVDMHLIKMESTVGLSTSTVVFEWAPLEIGGEVPPPLTAEQQGDLEDALSEQIVCM